MFEIQRLAAVKVVEERVCRSMLGMKLRSTSTVLALVNLRVGKWVRPDLIPKLCLSVFEQIWDCELRRVMNYEAQRLHYFPNTGEA